MSAIAICLGDLATWNNIRVRSYLMAGLNVASSLAIHVRVALLRIFLHTEGVKLINGACPTMDFSGLLAQLTKGLAPEVKLMTQIILASQTCDQRMAIFIKPFAKGYANLQGDVVTLVHILAPEENASRIAEMVRRLVETDDYVGICLYLYDELNGSGLASVVRALIEMACDGIVKTAFHDQSRKHRCGCFLRLERNSEAFAVAESLAASNPDNVDFQILMAQVMTCLPEHKDAAANFANSIKRTYRLNEHQLAIVEAITSVNIGSSENDS